MVEVKCSKCKKTKDSTFDFYWTGTKRSAYCKDCQKEYTKRWQRGHKKMVCKNSHQLSEKVE